VKLREEELEQTSLPFPHPLFFGLPSTATWHVSVETPLPLFFFFSQSWITASRSRRPVWAFAALPFFLFSPQFPFPSSSPAFLDAPTMFNLCRPTLRVTVHVFPKFLLNCDLLPSTCFRYRSTSGSSGVGLGNLHSLSKLSSPPFFTKANSLVSPRVSVVTRAPLVQCAQI